MRDSSAYAEMEWSVGLSRHSVHHWMARRILMKHLLIACLLCLPLVSVGRPLPEGKADAGRIRLELAPDGILQLVVEQAAVPLMHVLLSLTRV